MLFQKGQKTIKNNNNDNIVDREKIIQSDFVGEVRQRKVQKNDL